MRELRRTLVISASAGLLVLLLNLIGVVGFTYPRVIENDALDAPVRVATVSGDHITLGDGRVLVVKAVVTHDGDDLSKAIKASGDRIEIESNDGEMIVWVQRRGWICGTPWTQPIRVPLIPDDVPINRRVYLGSATEEKSGRSASATSGR